jgi:hypothetical protein
MILSTQELPFQRIEHQVATVDAQPSNESGGILVVVSGALLVSLRLRNSTKRKRSNRNTDKKLQRSRRSAGP